MPVHKRPKKHRLLVNQLNTLLGALRIPTVLTSPTDLTPPLLITILEAILCTRFLLDLPGSRESARLQQAKIFLGILETDVLEIDVGLSNVDPRRLANGELEEVLFIGELLFWIGHRHGIIPETKRTQGSPVVPEETRSHSPSISTSTKYTHTTNSLSSNQYAESITSLDSLETVAPPPKSSGTSLHHPPPRCIHEMSSPSIILSADLDGSFSSLLPGISSQPQSQLENVRYAGYISPVDEELELLTFESSRSTSSVKVEDQETPTTTSLIQALEEARSRTLFLKQERARLLEELSKYSHPGIS